MCVCVLVFVFVCLAVVRVCSCVDSFVGVVCVCFVLILSFVLFSFVVVLFVVVRFLCGVVLPRLLFAFVLLFCVSVCSLRLRLCCFGLCVVLCACVCVLSSCPWLDVVQSLVDNVVFFFVSDSLSYKV